MAITDLRRQIRSLVVLERDHLLETDATKASAIAATMTKNEATAVGAFAKYDPYVLPENAEKWKALRATFDEWVTVDKEVIRLAEAKDTKAATALAKTHSKEWEALIKSMIESADARLAGTAADTRTSYSTAVTTLAVVFSLSALLGLVAGVFIYRGIRGMVLEVVTLKDRLVAANESLEKTVEERTRTIRAILDHVRFGFFLVDKDLQITEGYTRSLVELLGQQSLGQPSLGGRRVSECLGLEGGAAENFDLQVNQIFEDVLPEELCCDQVPSRLMRDGRVLRVQASAVRDASGAVAQILFGISDVTDLEAAERSSRESQTLLRALKNPEPFRRFVADLNSRFGTMREAVARADEPHARRELHTIKGNASCYGLDDLAKQAHVLEGEEKLELPPVLDLEKEFEGFLTSHFDVLGLDKNGAAREQYRVDGSDLTWLEEQVAHATDLNTLKATLSARLERIRWQPAGQLVGPLGTLVAQLGQRLGKDVGLRVTGGDTLVLPERVQPILAVLPHLIRNAMDHAIEDPGGRSGKSDEASLEVRFEDQGDAWKIVVSDDGRGIDSNRVRAKAVSLGIISDDDALSHEDLCRLIFVRRLSTADSVSDISGRGEGLAAVAAAVHEVGGELRVSSTIGVGTSFVMVVPKAAAPSPRNFAGADVSLPYSSLALAALAHGAGGGRVAAVAKGPSGHAAAPDRRVTPGTAGQIA